MNLLKLFYLCLFACLVGCAQTSNTPHVVMPLIAQPLQTSAQQQLAIKRLSDIVNHVSLTDDQKAELYFQRGVRYDAMGLNHLANFDFNQAIQLKVDFAEVYNYLGIYYTLQGEFTSAYEAFDSVLQLKPEHEFSLLNRGIALYYGHRPRLAAEDFKQFADLDNLDPYRVIWLYLAERKNDPIKAKTNLSLWYQSTQSQAWAKNVVELYLGHKTVQSFYEHLTQGVKNETELTRQLCEAYFYLGQYYLMQNKPAMASMFFKLSLATNVYDYVEHRYAIIELSNIVY